MMCPEEAGVQNRKQNSNFLRVEGNQNISKCLPIRYRVSFGGDKDIKWIIVTAAQFSRSRYT